MQRSINGKIRQKGGADIALLVAFCVLFFSIVASFLYFSLYGVSPISGAKTLEKTIEMASPVRYYQADISIQPEEDSTRTALIKGTVFFDILGEGGYGTFSFPLVKEKILPRVVLETIFSRGNTYAKFQLSDATRESFVKFPKEWTVITNTEKGPQPIEILKDSFVLSDVFELFRKGREYLVVDGLVEKLLGGVDPPKLRFTLRASLIESLHPTGVSQAFDALLKKGKVTLLVDPKDKSITEVRYSINGYRVIMAIKNINTVIPVKNLPEAISLQEWKVKQFSSFVPPERVSEIFIGSYGNIKKEYLEAIRSSAETATGVKVTVLRSGLALPKKDPLYDMTRNQYNIVPVFKSITDASQKYGEKIRFIYVVDADMYSSGDTSRDLVWSKEELGTNAVIISLADLSKTLNIKSPPIDQNLIIARAQKIALRSIGTSVGFLLSPSSEISGCLMDKTTSLAELDKQEIGYCPAEIMVMSKFFGK